MWCDNAGVNKRKRSVVYTCFKISIPRKHGLYMCILNYTSDLYYLKNGNTRYVPQSSTSNYLHLDCQISEFRPQTQKVEPKNGSTAQ